MKLVPYKDPNHVIVPGWHEQRCRRWLAYLDPWPRLYAVWLTVTADVDLAFAARHVFALRSELGYPNWGKGRPAIRTFM